MAHEKILLVEDDEDIQELVGYNLTKEGYRFESVPSAEAALKKIKADKPDLALLDLMLPGMDGLDLCKTLKSTPETEDIPIVIVTAKGEESDIVAGLELGAEDYITKPFSPKVLIARLRTVLRRGDRHVPREDVPIEIHDLSIDTRRHRVCVDDTPIELTATEFGILRFLAQRPGWVFTRYQIVDGVKGQDYPVTERSVDVQIVGLRRKLGKAGTYIETVRGVGYRFKE